MATPFSEIYDIFLSNINSYKLALLDDISLEEEQEGWLLGSISYFTMSRTNVERYDTTAKQFYCSLSHTEKQILGKGMTLVYMNTHLLDEKNLSSSMTPKDFRSYSPAKQLETLNKVKDSIKKDMDGLMSRYSYSGINIKESFNRERNNNARPPFRGI